jgi:hypothetical protein
MAEAKQLLQAATSRHSTVAREAANGLGVDRHLFSLLSLEGELGQQTSAIFTDEMWTRFNTAVLSTSNVWCSFSYRRFHSRVLLGFKMLLGLKLVPACDPIACLLGVPSLTTITMNSVQTLKVNGAAVFCLGFGAVCPQGYGLGYTVEADCLRITVSNFEGDPDTGGSGFGGTVRVFGRNLHSMMPYGPPRMLEANMRVTNAILLWCPLPLTVVTVNYVAPLKVWRSRRWRQIRS